MQQFTAAGVSAAQGRVQVPTPKSPQKPMCPQRLYRRNKTVSTLFSFIRIESLLQELQGLTKLQIRAC